MNWDDLKDEALRCFLEYLRIDTSNPPGNETEGALFLKRILENEGIECKIYEFAEKRGNLIAKLDGNKDEKPLFLLNHIDVVPVERWKWTVDPFGGEVLADNIYGRGTQDMKAMGMLQMMTMILLKREKLRLNRDVYFVATADEEREGNYGVVKLIENVPDMKRQAYILNEGGGGTRGVFTEDDRVVWGIGVGEKSPLFLHLDVEGKAGHGSLPDKDNPNEILVRALNKILEFEHIKIKIPFIVEVEKRLGGLPDNKFINATTKNTISVTSLKAGVGEPPKENVIPSKSHAVLDCRLMPDVKPEEFIKTLEKIIDDDRIKITPTKIPQDSPISPCDTEFFRIIEKAAGKMARDSIAVPILVSYATDSRYFRRNGSICYGFTPVVCNLEELSLMHSDNERVAKEEFLNGIELLYGIVKEFCADI